MSPTHTYPGKKPDADPRAPQKNEDASVVATGGMSTHTSDRLMPTGLASWPHLGAELSPLAWRGQPAAGRVARGDGAPAADASGDCLRWADSTA